MKRFDSMIRIFGMAALWLAFGSSTAVAQLGAPWNAGPPLPFLQGPDLASTLRNGAQAASDQARLTATTAINLSRRAQSPGYLPQNLWNDYQNLDYQFQNLRGTFRALGELALQLQTPRAANAAAELDSALGIIAEAFIPVQQDIQAGTLNRDNVVRMGRVMNQALLEWQKELKRCSSRLGTIR